MEREMVCRSMKTNLQRCWWRRHDSTLHLKPEWCFGWCRVKEVRKNICFIFYWCICALSTFKSRYSRVIHRKPLSIKKTFLLAKVTEKLTLKMICVLSWFWRVNPHKACSQNCLRLLTAVSNSHIFVVQKRERLHYAFFTFYILLLISWNTNWKLCDTLQTYFPLNCIWNLNFVRLNEA